ncbi:MAG: tetratricopeptide repeat protein [Acidobacteria bacterium]|nr:MAG: tetratricopeptide repeat protein [Acidobacteriota bacterium]
MPRLFDPSALFPDRAPLAAVVDAPGTALAARVRRAREALHAVHRAAWLAQQGRTGEALDRARRALDLAPDDPWVLWATRRSDEHLALLRRHAERAGRPGPWRDLGQRLWDRGRHAAAADAYRRALELAPDDPETLLQYGTLLWGPLGRRDEGARLLVRFLETAPAHPAAGAVRRLLGAASRR